MRLPLSIPFTEQYAELIAHTASVATDDAFAFARELFALIRAEGWEKTASKYGCREWHYNEAIGIAFKALRKANAQKALLLSAELLDQAIGLSRYDNDDDSADDGCTWWRRAIEDHPQDEHSDSIPASLVVNVRDSAIHLVREDLNRLDLPVNDLLNRPFKVYHRITLFLLQEFAPADSSAVRYLLVSRNNFFDRALHHEYRMLLQARFSRLSSSDQDQILGWIESGPDWIRKVGDIKGIRLRGWQRDELALMRGALTGPWLARLKEYEREMGPAEPRTFLHGYTETWIGPQSPITEMELRTWPPEEVLRYMREWKPEVGDMRPSPEGLARDFQKIVTERMAIWTEYSSSMQGLNPTYVQSYLHGLHDGLRQNKPISWDNVLHVCEWVVCQPRTEEKDEDNLDQDHHWGWARRAAIDLISSGIGGEVAIQIPFSSRVTVWSIIEPLMQDPDPTPERDASRKYEGRDYYDCTINSVRGSAIEAVIKYALWVKKNAASADMSTGGSVQGFDLVPEARAVLESHIDPDVDPSPAIRAAYGRWLPWLVFLDEDWVRKHVPKIFPLDPEYRILLDAAWVTYVATNPAYDNVAALLTDEYSKAIDRIVRDPEPRSRYDPDAALAGHILTLYWRGIVLLHDMDGLLQKFYRCANDRLRSHAMRFVGRSLRATEDVDPLCLDRLMQLWEWRCSESPELLADGFENEFAAFGWWFTSGKLSTDWAFRQIKHVLNKAGVIEPDSGVIESLASLSTQYPVEAVNCLQMIVQAPKQRLDVWAWEDDTLKILQNADRSEKQEAHDLAKQVRSNLVAKGYSKFQ